MGRGRVSMGDASKFFEENILGLSDPEKYNLYSGLSEVADELSALHDQMNKLSEMADGLRALHTQMNKLSEMPDKLSALPDQMNKLSEMADGLRALHTQMNKLSETPDKLSALPDQMNRLEAALARIGRDMRELRKSVRVTTAAPKSPELRIKSRRRQPAADMQSSAPSVITKRDPPTKR
jgi:DNA repair ATPase RecN